MFGEDKDAARIGLIAHTAILHKLVSRGLEVLQPLSDDLRYDLAYYWEETAELIRIQCKAGRYMSEIGCILFKNFNITGGCTGRRGYIGDAEYFGVYCDGLYKDSTCLFFNTYNLGGEGKRQRRGYHGDAEYFGIYSQELRKVYLIHVDECPVGNTSLRLKDMGNKWKNQYSDSVRWAEDYEI